MINKENITMEQYCNNIFEKLGPESENISGEYAKEFLGKMVSFINKVAGASGIDPTPFNKDLIKNCFITCMEINRKIVRMAVNKEVKIYYE